MRYLYPFLCAVAGALALYLLQRDPPAPDYPRVIVHREAIERLEPDTVVRFVDRIRYVTPEPAQVAVAPLAAVPLVNAFCAPTVLRIQGDTARASGLPRTLLLRSGSLDRGSFFHSDVLRLTGPDSGGDLIQGTWRTRGSAVWRVAGDSVLVRYDRWALVKQFGAYGALFFAGRLSGQL